MSTFSVTGRVTMNPTWSEDLDLTAIVDKTTVSLSTALTNGTGNDQADAYWRDTIVIPSLATVTLDLRSLARQLMGGTANDTFSKVKMLAIENRVPIGTISVGGSVSDRWTALADGAINVGPGGVLYIAYPGAGYAVSAGDSVISITNNGLNSATAVDIYIVGVHA